MVSLRFLIALGALVLAGCGLGAADGPGPTGVEEPPAAEATDRPDGESSSPEPEPGEHTETALLTPPSDTLPPIKPKPKPPPPIAFDPNTLIGMDQRETARVLGDPTEIRDEPPSRVWIYRSGECAFRIFFYLDLASEEFHALAYEVLTGEASDEATKACLSRIEADYAARNR